MIPVVVDASALVEYTLGSRPGVALRPTLEDSAADLHVPALCDVEIASALRGLVAAKKVAIARALEALEDYRDLPLTRHGHLPLLHRALALRHNFTAYDAMYIALAETLGARLVSCDAPLVKAIRAHLPGQTVVTFPSMSKT